MRETLVMIQSMFHETMSPVQTAPPSPQSDGEDLTAEEEPDPVCDGGMELVLEEENSRWPPPSPLSPKGRDAEPFDLSPRTVQNSPRDISQHDLSPDSFTQGDMGGGVTLSRSPCSRCMPLFGEGVIVSHEYSPCSRCRTIDKNCCSLLRTPSEEELAGPECESVPETKRAEGNSEGGEDVGKSLVWGNGDEGLSDRELFGEFRGYSVINYDEPVHFPKGSMLKGVFTECEVVTVRELDIGDIVRYKKRQISLLKDQYGIVIKKDNISVVVDDIMYIPQKMGELGFGPRRFIEGEKCGYKIGKQTYLDYRESTVEKLE